MSVFPGYTRRELDREPLRNYRALMQQAVRIERDRQRFATVGIAQGSRIGQADSKDYKKAMRDLLKD